MPKILRRPDGVDDALATIATAQGCADRGFFSGQGVTLRTHEATALANYVARLEALAADLCAQRLNAIREAA